MAVEYVVGPILALLVSMKFTDYKAKKEAEEIKMLRAKIELVEKRNAANENEMPKKVMATVLPLAKAVQKLNQQVGL